MARYKDSNIKGCKTNCVKILNNLNQKAPIQRGTIDSGN